MVKGINRKKIILEELKNAKKPVTCKKLAQLCDVSRQVIVQDVALLRAEGQDIISTNNGYILNKHVDCSRVFKVLHDADKMEDEILTIVDLGGTVRDITVKSIPYGDISANLKINSRIKAKQFLSTLEDSNCPCLESLSKGVHYHTVSADSEQTLDIITDQLNSKGYLID